MSEHKHAALIAEWIKDTSRTVYSRYPINIPEPIATEECKQWTEPIATEECKQWTVWQLDNDPKWFQEAEYKFAEEHKIDVVSSLNDYEVYGMCCDSQSSEEVARVLVNAAAKREREDICKLSVEINWNDQEIWKIFTDQRECFPIMPIKNMKQITNRIITKFQSDLRAGKLQ